MRKSIAIVLCSMYALLAVGVHVHMHYCCGKLKSVQFFEPNETCCSHEDDHHSELAFEAKCCSNESLNINLSDEHEAFSWNPQLAIHTEATQEHTYYQGYSFVSKNDNPAHQANAPPGKTPIYIALNSLIYYA
jgi:hypothetical protein